MSEPEWISRRTAAAPEALTERFGSLLGQLLWSRGIEDSQTADLFLNPRLDTLASPFRLKDLSGAADRLVQAITRGEQIAVYADYDIDGMSGLALLVSFLEACGARSVMPYQPDRLSEGYGVHAEAIAQLAQKGVQVIVTVDTGIAAHEAALKAQELGIDLIVTDHHQQILDLPAARFVVNPNQHLDTSELGYLSGTGVAFYLAMAIRLRLRQTGYFSADRPEPDLKEWLDLFVLGTVADCVDLMGENRALVRVGLKQFLRTHRPGLRALLARTVPSAAQLSVRDVSFSVAPKLNAASRLGRADLSTALLLCKDPVQATELVEQILSLNSERSEIQSKVFEEALAQAHAQIAQEDPPVVVVRGEWHEGVLGIVAAKLVEKFSRPAIVLTQHAQDRLRGSMRTLQHFSCIRALDSCKEILGRYGGHRMAAGLQLASERFEEFTTSLWKAANDFLGSSGEKHSIAFDGELPLTLNVSEVETLDSMSPWGSGNPEPLMLIKDIDLSGMQILKEQHVKCQIRPGCDLIGFFKVAEVQGFQKSGTTHFDMLVTPEVNRFRNQKSLQLRLQYVRPSQNKHSSS